MRSILKTPQSDPRVRWMVRADMDQVLAIERFCYGDHAWSAQVLLSYLRSQKCIGIVAELPDGDIAGAAVYRLARVRATIVNIAVHPKFQGTGVGRKLLEHIRDRACKRLRMVLAQVPESNLPAQLFFRACGMRCISILPDHFDDQGAYLFHLDPCATAITMDGPIWNKPRESCGGR